MKFESQITVPTHRLVDADPYDKCPSVVQLIKQKKYPFYLIEIKADSFLVYGGNIAIPKKKKTKKVEKKHTGIGRKDKK